MEPKPVTAGLPEAGVPSPCQSVCRMADMQHPDAQALCEGCLRTLDEIASWSSASDEAKREVWARIATRRAQLTGSKP